MELAILNKEGQETGKSIELHESVFDIEANDHAIYLDAKQYMANNRQGTHKSKERAEVAGSTKKIKKQKGTGTARAGSIKSPLFVGGGRVFGPRPRNYRFKLNKKVKQLARKSALTYKAKNNNITVLEDFSFEKPKTRDFVTLQANIKVEDIKALFILNENNDNVNLSSRNIPNAKVITLSELTTYEILNAEKLVFIESALNTLQERMIKKVVAE
jgi:large subunit ribosomal protein L4